MADGTAAAEEDPTVGTDEDVAGSESTAVRAGVFNWSDAVAADETEVIDVIGRVSFSGASASCVERGQIGRTVHPSAVYDQLRVCRS